MLSQDLISRGVPLRGGGLPNRCFPVARDGLPSFCKPAAPCTWSQMLTWFHYLFKFNRSNLPAYLTDFAALILLAGRGINQMPYCNRCGVAFGGSGRYCQNCDKSTSNALITPNQRTLNQNSLSRPAFVPPPGFISPKTVSNITVKKDGSVAVEMNPDRVQCSRCKEWFVNDKDLGQHRRAAPSGCWKHGSCFGHSHNYVHAQHHHHSRCFAPGCQSTYKLEDGWPNEEIRGHVWNKHKPISDEDRNRQERLVADRRG